MRRGVDVRYNRTASHRTTRKIRITKNTRSYQRPNIAVLVNRGNPTPQCSCLTRCYVVILSCGIAVRCSLCILFCTRYQVYFMVSVSSSFLVVYTSCVVVRAHSWSLHQTRHSCLFSGTREATEVYPFDRVGNEKPKGLTWLTNQESISCWPSYSRKEPPAHWRTSWLFSLTRDTFGTNGCHYFYARHYTQACYLRNALNSSL